MINKPSPKDDPETPTPSMANDTPSMAFSGHTSVLVEPFLRFGFPADGKVFVDGTFGLGGHSKALLQQFPGIERIIGIDRDAEILKLSKDHISDPRITRCHTRFSQIDGVLRNLGIRKIDGFLLDLGVSSVQFDQGNRGFSFQRDGPLDMRMNQGYGGCGAGDKLCAADLVNTLDEVKLANILYEYGEEKFSRRISSAIVSRRQSKPFTTTKDLAMVVESVFPAAVRRKSNIHPATRVFQALRIAVNDELEELRKALEIGFSLLRTGGRMTLISFHSLEDRIVKNFFKTLSKGCTCPPDFPVCNCGKKPTLSLITHKPMIADAREIVKNPRSRSAKMRVAEKISPKS